MKLLYFSLLLFPIFIFAQSPSERQEIEQALLQYQELDNHPQLMLLERSLQKSEAALGKADTTTAKVYRELSECHYRNRNYEQALAYSLACLDALKSIEKYPERTAQAYTLAAKNLEQDIEKSKDYYQSSINLRSNRDNPANFENYIGMVRAYAFVGNYHMQLEYGKKAKELVQNPKQECEALEAIFGAYARLRNTKQGMINIESRLNISKTYGLTYQKGKAYSSLGRLSSILISAYLS